MTDPTNPGAWPDATRPGVPMNPERDGAHWLCISPATGAVMAFQWHQPHGPDGIGAWTNISKYITTSHPLDAVRMGLTYIAPCLTPTEIAAQVAAARAEVAALRDALANMLKWFGKYPEMIPAQAAFGNMEIAIEAARTALKEPPA